jgi:hypothetical protein
MNETWTTKRVALAGAIGGTALGLLLLSGADPSDSSTNDAYRSGQKAGYVVRYAILGAAAAFFAARILGAAEGAPNRTLALYLGGFAVVLVLAVVPPILDDESESERRRADAVRSGDERAEFRAGAIDGCVASVSRRLGTRAEAVGLNVDAFCGCLMDRLMAGAVQRGIPLEAVANEIYSGRQPPWASRAADACGRRASTD